MRDARNVDRHLALRRLRLTCAPMFREAAAGKIGADRILAPAAAGHRGRTIVRLSAAGHRRRTILRLAAAEEVRLAEAPGLRVAASEECGYRRRCFFLVRTFFRRAGASCGRIAAFVRRIHAAAAGQAGRDEVADVRDVSEVVGGTVEDGTADVAGRIGPRLVRTLAGEARHLVAMRRGRDTGPGAADLWLVRT